MTTKIAAGNPSAPPISLKTRPRAQTGGPKPPANCRTSENRAVTADVEHCANSTYRFLIRRSKSDPFGAGRIAFCSPRTAELLDAWRNWRGKNTWLFCPIYQDKPINRSLSDTTVKRLIRAAARRCCDPEMARAFSGHSMRVGAAQDLLKRGLDTVGIMRAGGWKSVNVLARYLENADHTPWL